MFIYKTRLCTCNHITHLTTKAAPSPHGVMVHVYTIHQTLHSENITDKNATKYTDDVYPVNHTNLLHNYINLTTKAAPSPQGAVDTYKHTYYPAEAT